jgi:carbon monoxide dehydrogenase subunit G
VKLENSFEVPASPEQTWELLNDVPRVVPCMPGAELTEVVDDDTFKAKMHVKLGPIALQFATDVVRDSVDEASRTTRMSAKARELKGRGGAQATIESSLEPVGTGTRVTIVTELALQGAVAQYGRGVVADVSNQLVKRFADCLADQLGEGGPGAAADASPAASVEGDGAATAAASPSRSATPTPRQPVEAVGGLGLLLRALFRPVLRIFGRR